MKTFLLALFLAAAGNTLVSTPADARGFELPRPHSVTLWWVIFNAPENCYGSADPAARCSMVDVVGAEFVASMQNGTPDPSLMSPNFAARPAMIYATGGVTDWLGRVRLTASIYRSPTDTPLAQPQGVDPLGFGRALENPDAEIHLVVRDHGRVNRADFESQILNFVDPYCSDPNILYFAGPNTCADAQFSVFGPGEAGADAVFAFADPSTPLRAGKATLLRDGDVVRAVFETRLNRR